MIGLLICATWMAGATPENTLSYREAHQVATKENRPMLILVGAEWCPACRVMKHDTLPAMKQQGKLKDVIFAQVNIDNESKIAGQLMRGTTIPQLVLYVPAPQGWYRMYLHGAQDEQNIVGLMAQGIELQRRDRELVKHPQPEKSELSVSAADE